MPLTAGCQASLLIFKFQYYVITLFAQNAPLNCMNLEKSSKYVHSLLRNNSTKMQAKKTTYIRVPKLFANGSNKQLASDSYDNNLNGDNVRALSVILSLV